MKKVLVIGGGAAGMLAAAAAIRCVSMKKMKSWGKNCSLRARADVI